MAKEKKKVGKLIPLAQLRKRYPNSKILADIEIDNNNTLRLPSRVLLFNDQIGGGIPYGHIVELYGEENIGKTLMALDFAYSAQQLGGHVLWDDAEGTFSPEWAKQNGLDLPGIELLEVPEAKQIEHLADWMADMIVYYRSKLKNNEPILLVTDSIAALDTIERLDASTQDKKAEMGIRAKAIDDLCRTRSGFFKKYGVCVIFINQLRKKLNAGMFEDPDTTPGGQAMRYYASLRIGLYGGALLKDSDKKRYGRIAYCRVKKTKVGVPKDNIKLEVIFREIDERPVGYSKYAGFPEFLVDKKIIQRKKANFYYKDKLIAKGEAAMDKVLLTDDNLRRIFIKKSKINTISKTREQLESLTKNLYPVIEGKAKTESEDEE